MSAEENNGKPLTEYSLTVTFNPSTQQIAIAMQPNNSAIGLMLLRAAEHGLEEHARNTAKIKENLVQPIRALLNLRGQ